MYSHRPTFIMAIDYYHKHKVKNNDYGLISVLLLDVTLES